MNQSTLTQKGQIVVPKHVRDFLHLQKDSTVTFEVRERTQEVVIRSTQDILALAGSFVPKKPISALHAREKFEATYERI